MPFIDGLRGLSILMVLFVHFSYFVTPSNPPYSWYAFPLSGLIIWSGTYGTRLFFMLSAYTLFRSFSFHKKIEANAKSNFFIRRFFRIMPVFWLWVLIYAKWGPFSHEPKSVAATLFLFMTFFRGTLPEVWAGAWSIYVEESFYLFFPVWQRLINSVPKALLWILLGWVTADLWEAVVLHFHLPTGNDFTRLFPLDNYYYFFFGILFYQLEAANFFERLSRFPKLIIALLDVGVVILLITLMTITHREAGLALAALFFMSFCQTSIFGKMARLKWMQKFGICCYSIYLSHQIVLQFLGPKIQSISEWLGISAFVEIRAVVWFPFFAALMLGLGILSYRIIEMPLVNLGRKIILKREGKSKLTFSQN